MTTPTTPLQDLLIQHIPDLRRFARALERNRVAADDLVQETLERAIKKMHLYEPSGPFIGWLNTIMRNIFVDRVRRRKLNASTSLDDVPHREPYQNENQVDRIVLKELRVAVGLRERFGADALCGTCPFAGELDPYDPYWSLAYINDRWYLASTAGTRLMGPYSDGVREFPGDEAVKLVRPVAVPDMRHGEPAAAPDRPRD